MSAVVDIRPAHRKDRDGVEVLWSALHAEQHALDPRFALADDAVARWRNDFREWMRSDSRWMWVADREGELVGFLTAERHFLPPVYRAVAELFLTEIYVVPRLRRQRVGRRMVDAALAVAEEHGIERLRLIALAENEVSLSFWRNFGARPFTETLLLKASNHPENERRRGTLGF